jgi:3-oxoacyl-[acyl-carrier protein] reductase
MSSRPRTIIITGAARGLGRALARRFAAEPATSLVLADLDQSGLSETAGQIAEPRATIREFPADVGDAEAVNRLVDEAVAQFGGLDVMINNAGILSPNARIHNLTTEDWDRTLRVNLMGVVHGIVAAVRVMRPRGGGSIINTASIAGVTAWTHSAPYGASKAAVIHLTKMAAVEYAGERIRVNCVCPGSFISAMQAEVPPAAMESVARRHPLGLGDPEDLVGAYSYLASDDSRWTTGTVLVVDGGYSLP